MYPIIEHRDKLWMTLFLVTETRLSEQDRTDLIARTIDCHLDDEDRLNVKGEDYTGTVVNTRKYRLVGDFGGRVYNATLEAQEMDKPFEVKFILGQPVNPRYN